MIHSVIKDIINELYSMYDEDSAQNRAYVYVNQAMRTNDYSDFDNLKTFSKMFTDSEATILTPLIQNFTDNLSDEILIDIAYSLGEDVMRFENAAISRSQRYHMTKHEAYVDIVNDMILEYFRNEDLFENMLSEYISTCYKEVLELINE